MALTSPDGTPITIRPIEPKELDRVVLRCWPKREVLDLLFAEQGTIGMAAWERDRCVAAQLHCYRVPSPDGRNEHWPDWNCWWSDQRCMAALRKAGRESAGPLWCHACCHVGRTLESCREETCQHVLRFAQQNDWDARRTLNALNSLAGVWLDLKTVESIINELQSSQQRTFRTIESQYHGRGIGTALVEASVRWAREHDYAAVVAMGAPDGFYQETQDMGSLPWTTYRKQGFEAVPTLAEGDELPEWAQASPPATMARVRAALAAGRSPHEFHCRLMILRLQKNKRC